jgi:hypothetical protein
MGPPSECAINLTQFSKLKMTAQQSQSSLAIAKRDRVIDKLNGIFHASH